VFKVHLNYMYIYIYKSSPYRAVNTPSWLYKTSQLMLYRDIIAVCSQIHAKNTHTLCEQNVEFVNLKPGGTYSNHQALKD